MNANFRRARQVDQLLFYLNDNYFEGQLPVKQQSSMDAIMNPNKKKKSKSVKIAPSDAIDEEPNDI